MKRLKILLALLLSVLMVFTMVSSSVVAIAETTPAETTKIEDVENTVNNTFGTIKGIIEGVHNLVGGIMSMLGKECVFCDEVHSKAETDGEDTQEPTEPETPPSEPEVPIEPEAPTEPETPVEPEQPTEPEEPTDKPEAEEPAEDKIGNAFDSLGNLFDSIHNLVGSILAIFGKECPFCDEVHSKGEGETEEPDEDGYYTVTFDLNYKGAPEAEKQMVKAGEHVVEPDVPVNQNLQFIGWFIDKNDTDIYNYYDFSLAVTENIILYARWMNMEDTDGEGLVDGLEEIYGTNKNLVDTDNDKISDYDEIIWGLDPLSTDSDNNGIADGDEDLDLDGLTYIEENDLNTDPMVSDTDEDGLLDGDEIEVYKTNPLLYDTDGDAVNDGREVELGTDPNVAEEYFGLLVECNTEKEDSVEPSLEIEVEGGLVDNVSIEPLEEEFFFPEEMPGYMGKAYDFDVDGDFKNAKIKFKFDAESIDLENGDEPVIYYFDEESQTLEALDTTIDGDTAIAEVAHFSTYVLINRKIYEESFSWIDVWDPDKNYTNVEIVLVIDDSGSLGGDYGYNSSTGTFTGGMDPEHKRLEVARTFVDKAKDSAKIGIVKFDSSVVDMTNGLVECNNTGKELLKNKLVFSYRNGSGFDSRGSTYMYSGIEKAISQFSVNAESTLKVVIVFTDGIAHDAGSHSRVINNALANDVKIYTVGLGNSTSYFNDYLKPLATNTGGAFYTTSDANELSLIYDNISQKIDITTDSDEDKIPDYYEDNMVYFNGIKIETDKNNRDTDGDGLLDGEEIEIIKEPHKEDPNKVVVKGRIVTGLPTNKDTDNDGYDDKDDFKPMSNYKTPIILLHGLNSNTQSAFGVTTEIYKGQNNHYDSNYSLNSKDYRDCRSHKIKSVSFKLGSYLTKNMKYKANKNLFAFNYPNQDMVQYNGQKLGNYIESLVSYAKYNKAIDVVDPEYLFASKSDMEAGRVEFILIGHSMGGLVSRYLVENIGTEHVEKVITIDTPHYGSGMANASDAALNSKFCPAIYELDTESTLYGGDKKKWDIHWPSKSTKEKTQYALDNQSPALKENHESDIYYYAIGGYNVNHGVVFGEIEQLAKPLRNTVFSFEFERDVSSYSAYKESINGTLAGYSYGVCGETSKLDLGDDDGDNTVDYMSQFGVRFRLLSKDKNIEIRRTALVVDSKTISHRSDGFLGIGDEVFHNRILKESELFENVERFVDEKPTPKFAAVHVVSDYKSKNDQYSTQYLKGLGSAMDGTNGKQQYLIPGQDEGMIPQGLAYYQANDWLLIAAYHKRGWYPSAIFAIDRKTGENVAQFNLRLKKGSKITDWKPHAGGIGVSEYNLYITGNNQEIARIPLTEIDVKSGTVKNIVIDNSKDIITVGQLGETNTAYVNVSEGILLCGNFYIDLPLTDDYSKENLYEKIGLTGKDWDVPASKDHASLVLGYKLSGNSSNEEWDNLKKEKNKKAAKDADYRIGIPHSQQCIQGVALKKAENNEYKLYLSQTTSASFGAKLSVMKIKLDEMNINLEDSFKSCSNLHGTENIVFVGDDLYIVYESGALNAYGSSGWSGLTGATKDYTDVIWKVSEFYLYAKMTGGYAV